MMDDPWTWDVDRVVKEFCTNDRSWRPITEPPKLPEPGAFEVKLRNLDVEGFALLDTEPEALCDFLSIKPLTQRRTLVHAVQQLRKRSRGYNEEQRKQHSENEPETAAEDAPSSRLRRGEPGEDDRAESKRRLRMILDRDPSPDPGTTEHVLVTVPQMVANSQTDAIPTLLPVAIPKNKRRIAPQMISTEIDLQNANRDIPTAADVVTRLQPALKVDPIKTKAHPYLGTNGISRMDFIDATSSLPGQKVTEVDDGWVFLRRHAVPIGRQRQVYRIMKRQMRLIDPLANLRVRRKSDMVDGLVDPDLDEVLPPYGQSDDEDGYDTDTWEEMEKEREETKSGLAKLSPGEIAITLEEIIKSHQDIWAERKLPRLVRNSHRIWQLTRGLYLRRCIQAAEQRVAHLEHRLGRIKQQFMGQEWRSKVDLESMSGNFEATVHDTEAARWELQIIRSSSAPEKAPRKARALGFKIRQTTQPLDVSEEEILSSEEEDDFIEYDESINEDMNMAEVPVFPPPMDVDGGSGQELGSDLEAEPEPGPSAQLLDEAIAAEQELLQEEDSSDGAVVRANAVSSSPPDLGLPADDESQDATVVQDIEMPDKVSEEETLPLPNDITKVGIRKSLANSSLHQPASDVSNTPPRPMSYEIIDLTSSPPPEDDVPQPTPPRTPVVTDPILDPGTNTSKTSIKREATPSSSFVSARKRRRSNTKRERQSYLEMAIDDLDEIRTKVVTAIDRLDDSKINSIFTLAKVFRSFLWANFVQPNYRREAYPEVGDNDDANIVKVAYRLVRFFDIWNEQTPMSWGSMTKADVAARHDHLSSIDQRNAQSCAAFSEFLIRISDRFNWVEVQSLIDRFNNPEGGEKEASMESDIEQEYGSGVDEDEAVASQNTPQKKTRTTAVDKVGRDLRKSAHALGAERNAKIQAFRAKMAAFGNDTGSSFIINESKEDDESLIYIHQDIAKFIKMHQVEGVRFMWNLITQRNGTRQGCLLAHSMGLGKTLQVITLLVTLAACSISEDDSIRAQIPEDLRGGHFLILCPPSLINNWYEELLCWSPDDHALGHLWKVDAEYAPTKHERRRIIEEWNNGGGVLLLPYTLFRDLVQDEHLKTLLLDGPDLVVADEAHLMKNPNSKLHMATAHFKTQSRIAMTGSPLANNVEEYHAMINWIAPGFLSDLKRFRDDFARPIHEGLQISSNYYQRRKMLARLVTLKKAVAPRVDRKTLAVLKNSMQKKTEFVISMPLTELQKKAYELLIRNQRDIMLDTAVSSNTTIFATLSVLSLLCAHPKCFQKKLMDKPSTKQIEQTSREASASSEENGEDNLAGAKLKESLVKEELELLGLGMKNQRRNSDPLSWKTQIFMAIVRECLRCGDSVLVFSQALYTLDHLESNLRMERISYVRLDGKTKMGSRQDMVKNFNKKERQVFLISTTAGGLGLNITGANRVIIFDFKFNPQAEQQAIGRAYRIGQTKEVFVYRLVCGGTFEEKMLDRVIFKMQLAQRVVDKKNPIPKAKEFAEFLDLPTDPPTKSVEKYRGHDQVLDAILGSENTRAGIRSITTMDTFEEEEVGDNEVSPEDRAEAEQLLNMHKGVPTVVVDSAQLPQMPPFPRPALSLVADGDLPTAILPGGVTAQSPPPVPPQSVAEAPAIQAPTAPQAQTNSHNIVAGPNVPLAPIAGASTSTRQPGTAEFYLANHRVFRGELKRAFAHSGSTSSTLATTEKRVQTAYKIADLLALADENGQILNSTQALKNTILEAAGTERFVEAICAGLVTPEALVSMNPEGVQRSCEQWKKMDDTVWDSVVKRPTISRTDPEHLQAALRRMKSQNNKTASSQKPHHLEDKAAMEAVMARRTKPLPGWATDAIQDSHRRHSSLTAPPSSSAPTTSALTSSSFPLPTPMASQQVKKPKNPFISD